MKTGIVAVLLVLVCGCAVAQDFKKHIVFLASPNLHGRAPASTDERNAANYLKQQFMLAGCTSVAYQFFPFQNDSALNVIGMFDLQKDSTVIISAHYDHLGSGSEKSLEMPGKKGIYPGADDNASGVALMLALVKAISDAGDWSIQFCFCGLLCTRGGAFRV